MPVTNKLLIPCRVLDSHFYHLSDSALSPPLPLSILPSQDSSSPVPSPFLNPTVSVLSHCRPTTTASSNTPSSSSLRPRLASATHPLNDRHPTLSTPLSWLLSLLVLFSPSVLLLYKSQRGLYTRTDVPSVGFEHTESRSKEKLRAVWCLACRAQSFKWSRICELRLANESSHCVKQIISWNKNSQIYNFWVCRNLSLFYELTKAKKKSLIGYVILFLTKIFLVSVDRQA